MCGRCNLESCGSRQFAPTGAYTQSQQQIIIKTSSAGQAPEDRIPFSRSPKGFGEGVNKAYHSPPPRKVV
jgi:hypothetical protein